MQGASCSINTYHDYLARLVGWRAQSELFDFTDAMVGTRVAAPIFNRGIETLADP